MSQFLIILKILLILLKTSIYLMNLLLFLGCHMCLACLTCQKELWYLPLIVIGQGGGLVNYLAEQTQIIDSPIHSAVEFKTGIVGKIRPNFSSPELSCLSKDFHLTHLIVKLRASIKHLNKEQEIIRHFKRSRTPLFTLMQTSIEKKSISAILEKMMV